MKKNKKYRPALQHQVFNNKLNTRISSVDLELTGQFILNIHSYTFCVRVLRFVPHGPEPVSQCHMVLLRRRWLTLWSNMLGREFPLSILESPFWQTHSHMASMQTISFQYWSEKCWKHEDMKQKVPEDLQDGRETQRETETLSVTTGTNSCTPVNILSYIPPCAAWFIFYILFTLTGIIAFIITSLTQDNIETTALQC